MENKQIFLMAAIIIAFGLGAANLEVPTAEASGKPTPGNPPNSNVGGACREQSFPGQHVGAVPFCPI